MAVVLKSYERSLRRVRRQRAEKPVRSRESDQRSRVTYSNGLAVFVNLLTGVAFTLAAAFASRFLLMMSFSHGFFIGGVLYTVLIVIGGTLEGV